MKKSVLLAAIICFLMAGAKAQLANTKWTGIAHLQQEDNTLVTVQIEWNFGKDTVTVLFASGGYPEVLTYSVKDNTVAFTKVSGGSPCETGSGAKYKFQITDDKLYFTFIESNCAAFSKALDEKPFVKEK